MMADTHSPMRADTIARRATKSRLIPLIAAITLAGCAGSQTITLDNQACCQREEASPHRAAIVRTATELIGISTLEVNGRPIAYDCADVTRAIFLKHGIDLYDSSARDPNANGVRLIDAHVRQYGSLHRGPVVHPGDLVFFDNTWDSNGDGRANDPLTHVGIVEGQEPDGTILFISRVTGAIERYRMNLAFPHVHKTAAGKILNDYLRRKDGRDPTDTGYLTGELFAQFGTRIRR